MACLHVKNNHRNQDGFGSLGSGTLLVGAERFELSTSRTRTVRSTGLSHAPTAGLYPAVRPNQPKRLDRGEHLGSGLAFGGGHREHDAEQTAHPLLAFAPNLAVMHFNHRLGDGEAQPHSSMLAG